MQEQFALVLDLCLLTAWAFVQIYILWAASALALFLAQLDLHKQLGAPLAPALAPQSSRPYMLHPAVAAPDIGYA